MGDAVNLGSRLEGTNKEYETRIIFSEGTYAQVQGQVICRRLGAVRVKGKRKPVKIFELRGIGTPVGKEAEAIAAFEGALDAYTEQQWDTAQQKFEAALALWGEDGPSRRYLEEIEHFRTAPPGPGWDGVYTATSK
ncbi:MAG: adenylate/guanylate cyclase domain-containing protein, partial [Myxococcaceae bacterium]|nr:adenylate/guanylate cyclase domain-containing protein [Myxococcaceae bacterium]